MPKKPVVTPATQSSTQLVIVHHPIETLVEADYNPRLMTEDQAKRLRESLERFGFVDPVIINSNPDRRNVIIGGHMRVRIARVMGKFSSIPCVELNLSPERERELNVRLNKNNGEWDFDILANQYDITNLLEWGFEKWELPKISEDIPTFDTEAVTSVEPVIAPTVTCPQCGHQFEFQKKDMQKGRKEYDATQKRRGSEAVAPAS